MFNKIAPYYDKMNNLISFGMHLFIKKMAIKALEIKPNTMTLDLCCGTGDFTSIINKISPKAKVIGLDKSLEMIKLAKLKNPQKPFIVGDCIELPFNAEEFDYITIAFGLRNVQNRTKAIQEIFRTLKSNGKLLHLDFGYHNKANKIFDTILPYIVKLTQKDEASYQYLIQSKNNYPEPPELIEEFEQQGFKLFKKIDFLFGAISAQIFKK